MRWNKVLILVLLTFLPVGLGACARTSENFYFGDYSEAEKLFAKSEYDDAILKYQAYIDENPEGNLAVIAEYYIAKSHQALGNTEEAKQRYQRIAKENPDLVWANFSETQLKEIEKETSSS